METKRGDFVSIMKNKIISASIDIIRSEGLKFSVDTLASNLKVSKKTIYKYFPNKEALALSLYEKYYSDAIKEVDRIIKSMDFSCYRDLLFLYFDSKVMTRDDIFNKYKLNETIYSYVEKKNDLLWIAICKAFSCVKTKEDREALKVIIDGSFEKLCSKMINPNAVIERLIKLL